MLKKERQKKISDLVAHKKSVSVSELASLLFVSEATIRRDIAELEKAGVIGRTHGGAFLPEGAAAENPATIREKLEVHAKRKIAELARDFIRADMTVFMDSSSSAGMLIPYLCAAGGVSVITNGIRNCFRLMEKGDVSVYLCGGKVNRYSDAALGVEANAFISRFRADLCVISCGGISEDGATEASPEQAEIKRKMLKNSELRIMLCDGTKIGKRCMSHICDFDGIDFLITDTPPKKEIYTAAEKCGCEILCAEANGER